MSDSWSKIILILFWGQFWFKFLSSFSIQRIFEVVEFNLVLIVWILWSKPWSNFRTESQIWTKLWIFVMVKETVTYSRNNLLLHNQTIFKIKTTLANTVWKEIIDWLLRCWDNFDMKMSKYFMLWCFVEGTINRRNIRNILLIILGLILLFFFISRKKSLLKGKFSVIILTTFQGLVLHYRIRIHNLNKTVSLNNSEGNSNILFRVNIDEIFTIKALLFNSIV